MNEANILETTYNHIAKVERNQETEVDNETKFTLVTIADSLKCAVSQSSGYNAQQTESLNKITYNMVMFCDPSADIKAGDSITVTFENGFQKSYDAGEPSFYTSHLEVPLLKEGEA